MTTHGRRYRFHPEEVKKIIHLRDVDKLPMEVIAERFGRSRSSISYIYLAEKRRKKCQEEKE